MRVAKEIITWQWHDSGIFALYNTAMANNSAAEIVMFSWQEHKPYQKEEALYVHSELLYNHSCVYLCPRQEYYFTLHTYQTF